MRRKGRDRYVQYMAWIKTQVCCVCPAVEPYLWIVEAAHVGERGLMQKCSDLETIPLCALHHRLGKDSHHRLGKKFWEHHRINRDQLIRYYQDLYIAECGAFATT